MLETVVDAVVEAATAPDDPSTVVLVEHDLTQKPLFPPKRVTPKLKLVPVDNIILEEIGEAPSAQASRSIDDIGVLVPVQLGPAEEEGFYYVKEGRRRVIAARAAGIKQIPASITGPELSSALVRSVSHALRKSNLAAEYMSAKELLRVHYGGIVSHDVLSDFCKRTGIDDKTLKKMLTLDALLPEFMTALLADQITAAVALALAKLTTDQQRRALTIFHTKGTLTAADVRSVRQVDSGQESLDLDMDDDLRQSSTEDPRIGLARQSAIAIRGKLAEYSELLEGGKTVPASTFENLWRELCQETDSLLATLGAAYVPEAAEQDDEDDGARFLASDGEIAAIQESVEREPSIA